MKKAAEKEIDTLYYKPHFGPEETLDNIQKNLNSTQQKKEFIKMNLNH